MEQIEKYRKSVINKRITAVVILGALSVFAFVTYLQGTSKLSMSGFKVSEAERTVNELLEENKKLTLELSKIKNMASIEEYSVAKSMVKVEKVEYINTASNMAMK